MSFSDIWKLKKRGARDSERHKDLIKDAIKKNGKELINQYDIIKSDGNKKIKIPMRFLERYRFKYSDHNEEKGVGQGADVKPGQTHKIQKGKGNASADSGEAGDQAGDREYSAEISVDELVNILIKELDLPWMEPNSSTEIQIDNEEFNSIERKGIKPNLDIKKSLLENLKRNAAQGRPEIGDFHDNDLRYKTWDNETEYHSNAVIYLMMDRSASMDKEKTDITKTFYFWIVQFLKKRYKNIDIIFIAHDAEAWICEEHDFFRVSASGGTKCSSAFLLALEHMQKNYSPQYHNIYVLEVSDGDNWGDDNLVVLDLIYKMQPYIKALGYGEIITSDVMAMPWYAEDKLLSGLISKEIEDKRCITFQMHSKEDIFNSVKKFFGINKKK